MKPIAIALSGLAFVVGAAGVVSPTPARADEPQLEEAYTPPKEQPDTEEVGEPTKEEKSVADINRQKKMKAKARRIRRGNATLR